MIFGHRVWNLIAVRGDALRSRDIDERMVPNLVRRLCHIVNCLQLRLRMHEAFIAPRNIVIYFDPGNVAGLCFVHDLLGVSALQPVSANANVVGPILLVLLRSCGQTNREEY